MGKIESDDPYKPNNPNPCAILQSRLLGTGGSSLAVSSLGFGCMGLNYHRGNQRLDRKAMHRLLHQAVERALTSSIPLNPMSRLRMKRLWENYLLRFGIRWRLRRNSAFAIAMES